ncbi:hypothetical protein GQ600_18379 [Phytophthora cactorum]|nr:hypothetical protein GQ600_18379 [Phytophthora cactorum]
MISEFFDELLNKYITWELLPAYLVAGAVCIGAWVLTTPFRTWFRVRDSRAEDFWRYGEMARTWWFALHATLCVYVPDLLIRTSASTAKNYDAILDATAATWARFCEGVRLVLWGLYLTVALRIHIPWRPTTYSSSYYKEDSKAHSPPPSPDDYGTWTVDQLKLECTARKLAVAKNTIKADKVTILRGYDESQVAMKRRVERQRVGKRDRETGEPRGATIAALLIPPSKCTLLRRAIRSGDVFTQRELDVRGRQFWEEVAEADNTINEDFDRLVYDGSLFEGI